MTQIYVLCSGERAEGHDPVSLHWSWWDAKRALRRKCSAQLRPMGEIPDGRSWMATDNGVDEWWIYRMPILSADGGSVAHRAESETKA